MVTATGRFYGCSMDIVFVWLFIFYGTLILFPFMIPAVHASIDAVKAVTRGPRREQVERSDKTLRAAVA
jgi:hypothetical protein